MKRTIGGVKNTKPKVPCYSCGGSGEVEINEAHLEVLTLVARLKEATAPAIYEKLSDRHIIGVTSVNNRLEDLRLWGFVSRTKHGRQWIYQIKEKT